MKEYIERDLVLNKFRPYEDSLDGIDTTFVLAEIEQLPAADVVERKHGEWETVGVGITERTRCSNCKSTKGSWSKPPFCNQCGADMRGEKNAVD